MSKEINVGFDGGGMKGKIDDITASMTSMSGTTSSLIASVQRAAGVFLAFRGATFIRDQFVNATTAAIEFEDSIAQVQKVTSRFEAQQLSGSIRDLATDIPIAREEITSIVEQAGRLGIEGTENIENFTESVGKLAVATNLSAEDAAKSFSRIIAVTDASVDEIEHLGSVVNELSNTMATSASEITDGMLRASAAASRLGLQAESIAGFSASINEVSATARRANTRLRRLFQEIQSPRKVEGVTKAIGGLDEEFKNFSQFAEEEGKEAVFEVVRAFRSGGESANVLMNTLGSASRQALAGLAQNFESLRSSVKRSGEQMKENTSLQREFEIQAGTTASRIQLLGNNYRNLQTRAGEAFIPFIRASTNALIDMADALNHAMFGVNDLTREIETLIGSEALGGLKDQLGRATDGMSPFSAQTTGLLTGITSLGIALASFTGGLSLIPSVAIAATGSVASLGIAFKEGSEESDEMTERIGILTSAMRSVENVQPEVAKQFSGQIKLMKNDVGALNKSISELRTSAEEIESIDLENINEDFKGPALPSPSRIKEIQTRLSEVDNIANLSEGMLADLGEVLAARARQKANEAFQKSDIRGNIVSLLKEQTRGAIKDYSNVSIGRTAEITDGMSSLLEGALSDFDGDKLIGINRNFADFLNRAVTRAGDDVNADKLSKKIKNEIAKRIERQNANQVATSIEELISQGQLQARLENVNYEDIQNAISENLVGEDTKEKLRKKIKGLGLRELINNNTLAEGAGSDSVNKIIKQLLTLSDASDKAKNSLESMVTISAEEFIPEGILDRTKIQKLEQLQRKADFRQGAFSFLQGKPGQEQKVLDSIAKAIARLKGEAQSFGDVFKQSLKSIETEFTQTMTDMVIEGEASFEKLGESLLRNLTQKLIQQNITNNLLGSGDELGGLAGEALGGISRWFSGGDALITDDGKVVNFDSRDNVLAFRDGGLLNKTAQKDDGGGGGGNTQVNVINNTDENVDTQRKQSDNGEIIDVVVGAVASDIESGGENAKAIKQKFGISPQPQGF